MNTKDTVRREHNLWTRIGNKCLQKAEAVLDKETALTTEDIKTVQDLVGVATTIDHLNLLWEEQTRYGAAVFRDRPFSQPAKEN